MICKIVILLHILKRRSGTIYLTDTGLFIARRISKSEKVYTTKDKQSFYSQLKYYQNIRAAEGKPVSDGWVSNTFRDKFGEWPRSLHATPQEITPEVSNFITHKRIQWVKRKQKTEALMPQRIADLKQQLNKNAQQGELL